MPVENPSRCKKPSATLDVYFKGARLMNTPGLLKCAGAVVALAICFGVRERPSTGSGRHGGRAVSHYAQCDLRR